MMKNEAQKEHRAPFKVKYLCINLAKCYKENQKTDKMWNNYVDER